jgi:hypothetical protein
VSGERPTSDNPFDKLEEATRSLEKEREFFAALMNVRPVAIVVNRIIHLTTFFNSAAPALTLYFERQSPRLFPTASMDVAAVLAIVMNDIVRSIRLATYLCVKGIPDQALVVLRSAIEQIGVYTHVWHEPDKHRFVPDSESDDFSRAFRSARDKALAASLKARNVRYRFMHCKSAKPLSALYSLLSAYFVHGQAQAIEPMPNLCCEFVDRAEPKALGQQYEMVQAVMSLIYMELIGCIPSDDLLTDELAVPMIAFTILGPTLSSLPGQEDPELTASVDRVLSALASLKLD